METDPVAPAAAPTPKPATSSRVVAPVLTRASAVDAQRVYRHNVGGTVAAVDW
jgi:hypothetical protein